MGRPPTDPIDYEYPELYPQVSRIAIELSREILWTDPLRRRLAELQTAAAALGLTVLESESPERAYRKWALYRVDHEFAFATIVDFPGITFDDWVADIWYPVMENPDFDTSKAEARKRGYIFLHKLKKAGRVKAKKHPRFGKNLLFRSDAVPTSIAPDFAPPRPPGVVADELSGKISRRVQPHENAPTVAEADAYRRQEERIAANFDANLEPKEKIPKS